MNLLFGVVSFGSQSAPKYLLQELAEPHSIYSTRPICRASAASQNGVDSLEAHLGVRLDRVML
jgi:hypothetical protein